MAQDSGSHAAEQMGFQEWSLATGTTRLER